MASVREERLETRRVRRRRLAQRLDQRDALVERLLAPEGRVVLVCAPAGSGKTFVPAFLDRGDRRAGPGWDGCRSSAVSRTPSGSGSR
jgi:ATP/maltotriose-dependent transcriptional regulator MalT